VAAWVDALADEWAKVCLRQPALGLESQYPIR
jgi:hypothetical protein